MKRPLTVGELTERRGDDEAAPGNPGAQIPKITSDDGQVRVK
ncbi:MAG TPA: hypothetical protein VJU86_04980 [Pyrinomonadaceae bacterium]|nr:hypothetical protein [Pyrinomonadaceae bacterium]